MDFSQKVGKDCDRVPANIITTEEFHDIYDKNFLYKPSKKKRQKKYSYYSKVNSINEHLVKLFSKKFSCRSIFR